MIHKILPGEAIAVEAFDDTKSVRLFPSEEEVVAQAVERRRREFATTRRCAREALAALGYPAAPVLPGDGGAPAWPEGVVGSITHCLGYRATVVAPRTALSTIGIDAEPNDPLPAGVLASIARPDEERAVHQLLEAAPLIHWDRLLFSAKESVYKAWFPLTRRRLEFDQVTITFHRVTGRFDAQLHTEAVVEGRPLTGFTGRFLAEKGLLLSAVACSAQQYASRRPPSGDANR